MNKEPEKIQIGGRTLPADLQKVAQKPQTIYVTKTYRLSLDAVKVLDKITDTLSTEARIHLAKSKVLELIIFNAMDRSLDQLLK